LCSGSTKVEICTYPRAKARALLDVMITKDINAPPACSCGHLFDAVAAALVMSRLASL
jgi:hydrogenase maturation factor HypF (carbamoyltransferase family)